METFVCSGNYRNLLRTLLLHSIAYLWEREKRSPYLGCCPPPCYWNHPHSKYWSRWRRWHHCSWSPSSAAAGHMPRKMTITQPEPSYLISFTTWELSPYLYFFLNPKSMPLNSSLKDFHHFILQKHYQPEMWTRIEKNESSRVSIVSSMLLLQ